MAIFDITNNDIKDILQIKGVDKLYHTNTVETSLSFFKAGGLLSRGQCLDMGFPQTNQDSDEIDKPELFTKLRNAVKNYEFLKINFQK